MSEQQQHLTNLVTQRDALVTEINELNSQASAKRELLLRASGAIEYLQQIGVTLPEPEEAPAEEEAAVEPEVVTEPTPETPEG